MLKSKYSKYQSFTLIELMISIVILCLLSAIGFPTYINYVERATVIEAVSILGEYKIGIGDFWSTVGRLPTTGDTLISTPANLPVGQTVTANLPTTAESITLINTPAGDLINIVVQANVLSTFSASNRTLTLGVKSIGIELFFACGNYTTGATASGDIGFTQIGLLPNGCNYNGVNDWLNS